MDIWMIWVRESDGYIWLLDAWDDDSVSENHDGWLDALAKAEKENTIRVVKSRIDFDVVTEAFKPAVATLSRPTVELSDVAVADLARRLHPTSDHGVDGTTFGAGLCNCEKVARRVLRVLDEPDGE